MLLWWRLFCFSWGDSCLKKWKQLLRKITISIPTLFFSEEKRKLSIIYIYPNQVFVEKTSHAELKNDVVNLAELNRIVHCLLNIYIYTGYLLPAVHSLTYWKLVREFSSFWKHVIIDRKMILRYIAPEIKIKYNFFQRKLMFNSSTTLYYDAHS